MKPTVRIAVPPELAELRRKQAEQLAKDAGTNADSAKNADASKSSRNGDDFDGMSSGESRSKSDR